MKKLTALFLAAVASVALICGCNVKEDNPPPTGTAPDPFDFAGNTVNPEVIIDGKNDDELWQDESVAHTKYSSCDVSILRRPNAIYLFYKVKDVTPYSYVNQGAADEVTHSDSIEFYFDTNLAAREDRVYEPGKLEALTNCYQVNLGRDSRTRILSGTGEVWLEWAAMYTFEVREGYGSEEEFYYVEAMLPVTQMNIGVNDDIGIAFGLVDRTNPENQDLVTHFTWSGMAGIDPQHPSTYLVLKATGELMTYDEYKASKA